LPLELTRSSTAPAADDGGTRVDLGEDLLEQKTAMLTLPVATPHEAKPNVPPPTPELRDELLPAGPIRMEQVDDLIQSARILAGEGLLEDAKKVLRRILLADPGRITARKMLEEIHETELKQIFGDSDLPRRRPGTQPQHAVLEASAETVLRGLDRDMALGMLDDRPSLFRDREALEEFGARMDRDFSASPAEERIDLGIAFLEMGLPALAVHHFRAAVSKVSFAPEAALDQSAETDGSSPLLVATGLLAYALITDGRAFDATLALQQVLNDVEIRRERKLELLYLMGRAFESLEKPDVARGWYAQAAEIEPHYRDLDERLRAGPRR
jgi:tetratricopeptide (TPR) repeat protein